MENNLHSFEIESSWGTLYVQSDGSVSSRDVDEEDEENYLKNIVKIDLEEYYRYMATRGWSKSKILELGELDILEVGYWKDDESYEKPCNKFRKELILDNHG